MRVDQHRLLGLNVDGQCAMGKGIERVAGSSEPVIERRAGRSYWFRLLLGVGISALFVYFLAHKLDWRLFRGALARVEVTYLLLALLFLSLDYGLRLLRWHWMLRAVSSPVSLRGCARPFFIGFALNNLLPLRAGDLARAIAFRQRLGAPVSAVLGTLVVERLLDLLVVLLILGVALALVAPRGAGLADIQTVGWVALLCAGLAVAAIIILVLLSRSRWRLHPVLQKSGLGRLGEALSLFASPVRLAPLLCLSLAAWLLEVAVFASVAWSLGLPASGSWSAMGAGTLGTLLPGSPGHLGTFDFFAMNGMMIHGVERNLALAYAVVVHVVLWLPLTALGVLLLLLPTEGSADGR